MLPFLAIAWEHVMKRRVVIYLSISAFFWNVTGTFICKQSYESNIPYFQKDPNGFVVSSCFLKGVAYSTYQNGGHRYWSSLGYIPKSNWSWFETECRQRFRIDRIKKYKTRFLSKASPIDYEHTVGLSAAGWDHLFEDIALMKALGVNALRFDLPWADLNPEEHCWNEEAFALYDRYIDALLAQGITPLVTLYHWVHPLWFHERGGWEEADNIKYFIRFCKRVFRRYGDRIRLWCTINEPTVISACGYIMGSHAPGIKNRRYRAGRVLLNLCRAHVEVYYAIKKLPYGDQCKVCLVHQIAKFEPRQGHPLRPLNSINKILAKTFNKNFAHDVILDFFKTGDFSYHVVGNKYIEARDERAPHSLDFIGLNFYASVTLGPWPTCHYGETMTDMVWAIRPHSMYEGIKDVARLGVPIVITENGIPDARDDRREQWIVGNLNAVKRAMIEGYDIRGFFYWSFLDNFEWNMGHEKKFGLYAVDTLSPHMKDKKRTLRKGSLAYRDYFITASNDTKSNKILISQRL